MSLGIHASRREALQVGVSAFGLSLANRFAATAADSVAKRPTRSIKSCVLIWLDGGPSHIETLDPKPLAPSEVRGPLGSISTRLPGVSLTECLPEVAQRLDRFSIVRSVTSPLGEHNFGTHYMMSGYRPTPVVEYPAFNSAAAFVSNYTGKLPAHVAVPDFRVGGGRFSGNGFLPGAVAPFSAGGDPAKPGFRVRDLQPWFGLDSVRLSRRQEFLNRLNGFLENREQNSDTTPEASKSPPGEFDQAWDLITSNEARAAFDLSDEPAAVKTRYGRKTVGQSCLLARRLIERGVPFVTVNQRGWDTHADLYTRLKEGFTGARKPVGLVPSLDLAVSALSDDLADRGLLDETLIVVMGEFGRTPKLNTRGGRDHWPRVFSVLLAGGGINSGQVIGSSDRTGESPLDRPVTPADLAATIHTALGVDPATMVHTPDGRPIRLASENSHVIDELLA